MIKYILIIAFSILIQIVDGYSQISILVLDKDFKAKYKLADGYISMEKYQTALPIFKKLLNNYPDNVDLNFKLGLCYLYSSTQKRKALIYLPKALKLDSLQINSDTLPIDAYYYLARAYHANYKFKQALDVFQFLNQDIGLKENSEFQDRINTYIKYSKNGIELTKNPIGLTIVNLGEKLNSNLTDHSQVLSRDEKTLVFTSRRKSGIRDKVRYDGEFDENIYISYRKNNEWSEPVGIAEKINTKKHEASTGLSADGTQLFFTRSGKVFRTIYINNEWSEIEKAKRPVNKLFSNETHATLSPDGEYLYFTSDRPGGYGGLDIYYVKINKNNWGEVKNLGPNINTSSDEETPYLHSDGKTLYFSSKGHNSMGGYDLFKSKLLENGNWDDAVNLGYPISTTEDDVFFIPGPHEKKAYYSSERIGGFGKNDLYCIWFHDRNDYPIVTGNVSSIIGENLDDARIVIRNITTQHLVSNYVINPETGNYQLMLTPDIHHNFVYEAPNYLFYSEDFLVFKKKIKRYIQRDVKLKPIISGKTKETYYIELNENEKKLSKQGELLLKVLGDFLQRYPKLHVDISMSGTLDDDNVLTNVLLAKQVLLYEGIEDYRITEQLLSSEFNKPNVLGLTVLDAVSKSIIKKGKNAIIAAKFEDYSGLIVENKTAIIEYINENTNKIVVDTTIANITKLVDKDTVETSVAKLSKPKKIIVVKDMIFGFNKDKPDNYQSNLNELALYLKQNPKAKIEIRGYTDAVGSAEYNKKLAKRRAGFVKNYLISKGVPDYMLIVETSGEGNPIAINNNTDGTDNPTARKFNRRIEINILKQGDTKLVIEKIKVPDRYTIANSKLKNKTKYAVIIVSSKIKIALSKFSQYTNIREIETEDEDFYYSMGEFTDIRKAQHEVDKAKHNGYSNAGIFILGESQ